MDIQKFTVPLTITAAVVGIWVFLRGGSNSPVTGSLPQPLTLPTFSAVPFNPTNIATPTPAPTASSPIPAPATAARTYAARAPFLPYNPPGGVVYNYGMGAPTPVLAVSNTGTNSTPSNSCCDPCSNKGPKTSLSYARQISQSAVL